jgi:hypothetical protein
MVSEQTESIVVRSAGEDGYYFSFQLPFHSFFVSIFSPTLDATLLAVDQMRSELPSNFFIHRRTSLSDGVNFICRDASGEPVGQSTSFELVADMEIAIEFFLKQFPEASIISPSESTA